MGMLPTYPGTDWPVREKQLAELEPSSHMMRISVSLLPQEVLVGLTQRTSRWLT